VVLKTFANTATWAPAAELERDVANWIDARSSGKRVTDESVKTFDSGWHSAGRNSGNLWNIKTEFRSGAVTVSDKRLVSLLVGRGEFGFVGQTLLKLGHQATCFESRNGRGCASVG
jgi:hypothetical protein